MQLREVWVISQNNSLSMLIMYKNTGVVCSMYIFNGRERGVWKNTNPWDTDHVEIVLETHTHTHMHTQSHNPEILHT